MGLKFTKPAAVWQEAFPMGNGRIGALVYGDGREETIRLNEDTLWSGYPQQQLTGMQYEDIQKAEQLVKKGKYLEAAELLDEKQETADDVQMYEPFGDLKIKFSGERSISEYERYLDLDQAAATVTYCNYGKKYQHFCFCSAPAQVFVYQIKAEEDFSVEISGEGGFINESRSESGKLCLYGQLPGPSKIEIGWDGTQTKPFEFSEDPKKKGIYYEGWCLARTESGTISCAEGKLICENARDLELRTFIRSSFRDPQTDPYVNGKNPEKLLERDQKKAEKSLQVLFQDHLEEYRKFYRRVELQLESDNKEEMDLRERLEAYRKEQQDPGLEKLLFDYGRYLLISSSRPGTQPANLQGIWNCDKVPPWNCDYTVNINTEMNYWMTGPCNLHELIEPLVRMNAEMLENAKKTAEHYFHCEGAASFHNIDLWRKTSPAKGHVSWSFWPFGGAWMCRNLFDEYLFVKDENYLKDIFPILEEHARFCSKILQELPEGLAAVPATSPENSFFDGEEATPMALYTENTLAIIRNLFRDYLEACRILEKKSLLAEEIKEKLPRMIRTRIDSRGRIMEWNEAFREAEPQHRHLSHLYELHPGRGISRKTPELYEAVRKSMEARGDDGSGWSLAWKIIMWARLENGTRAADAIGRMLQIKDSSTEAAVFGGGVYPNLFCAHPPFQIDGNLGYTAGIAEMLLQSQNDEIVILPALSPKWKTGSVKGLIARGAIAVDILWDEKKITYRMCSQEAQTVKIRVQNQKTKWIVLEKAEPYQETVDRQ